MKLVKNGADINYRNFKYSICKKLTDKVTSYPDKNTSGNTPLTKAAKKGYLNIVKFLVENDADVNQINLRGETALDRAIENGHLDVIKFLVENNADINHTNQNGKTALILIADNNIEGLKFLIENGAKIECIDNFWESINKVNLEVKEYLQSWILNSSKNEINSPNSSNQSTTNIKKQSLLMI
ncbi:ankyrin repeat domain-containing protein [Spiroplasma endosymbiont of Danaus chrysippus]|uniref:ankyrin repeat domain-containing protein n=1 Tax=Spiroplasma endosymbiont of Danaus chrysippus TaxID=2691041 RepID=UPI002103DD2E|nr:ankyrin repeat domain-containing protein [Spiroplasma endosymbiont of Danaus chrysippus]